MSALGPNQSWLLLGNLRGMVWNIICYSMPESITDFVLLFCVFCADGVTDVICLILSVSLDRRFCFPSISDEETKAPKD